MKFIQKLLLFLFLIFIAFFINCSFSNAFEKGDFTILYSQDHVVNEPSIYTQIKMIWDMPYGYTEMAGYYYVFNYTSTHTFIKDDYDDNTVDTGVIFTDSGTEATSSSYENSDDIFVYFHIAPMQLIYDEEEEEYLEEIGKTTSYGPVRIDDINPKNVSITPDNYTTTTQNITLTIGGTDADGKNYPASMYISNIGFGEGGEWETFSSLKPWILTEGAGEKTIYLQVKDAAGNISTAVTSIVYNETTSYNIDIDESGDSVGGTDGLLILRYLFGLRGESLINGIVDIENCTRCTSENIESYLSLVEESILDADGDGDILGGTDGLLFLRYTFGLRGESLIKGVVSPYCSRCDYNTIQNYINTLTVTK